MRRALRKTPFTGAPEIPLRRDPGARQQHAGLLEGLAHRGHPIAQGFEAAGRLPQALTQRVGRQVRVGEPQRVIPVPVIHQSAGKNVTARHEAARLAAAQQIHLEMAGLFAHQDHGRRRHRDRGTVVGAQDRAPYAGVST